jgi:hypothetical protein
VALADRYGSVVGIDNNPRAVAFSRINARINGRDATFQNAELPDDLRIAQSVDHVVFNSPTGPGHRNTDGEPGWMTAERAVADLVTRLPDVLMRPGLAQILLILELQAEHASAAAMVNAWTWNLPDGYEVADVTEFPNPCSPSPLTQSREGISSLAACSPTTLRTPGG